MKRSISVFLSLLLFVALSKSFPKQYLVETETESGKDIRHSVCVSVSGFSGKEKTFKDGETFYEDEKFYGYDQPDDQHDQVGFKCKCNDGKPLTNKANECNWHYTPEPCPQNPDYCWDTCMDNCDFALMLTKSECSKICSYLEN